MTLVSHTAAEADEPDGAEGVAGSDVSPEALAALTDHSRFPPTLPVVASMRKHASGRRWLAGLPALVDELRGMWRLRLGPPFHGGSCSWVAPAVLPDGTPAVFKVTWPHPEARHEAEALRLRAGHGAVRVYAHDADRYALLLERCDPGTELGRATHLPPEHRLTAACAVLRQLWSVHGDFTAMDTVRTITADWADVAEERAARPGWPDALDTGLFTLAAGLLRELPLSAPRSVLVHGDFNPGNVLAARRSPWLAIDTKPMTGDPAFDPWPLIEQVDDPFAYGDAAHTVLTRRTALVADALGTDVDRVRAWCVARHVEYALWSVDEDENRTRSVELLRQARVLADVAGL
ncbi:aminoglycoside phosphotransferase family protein [Streptomyces sp. HNM0574]|uniref:aminoglycoside phosphotransferase family protein n=1 Tax=Streptomyces sp. HNM0574 TaxID=2714954 RepID=UPI00146B3041|nr:aminoglycoside phosphotransferase family protein [Streptomyces sp. HNM0574]NLU66048.1 phosphotransferase [Streptomyces sp. HNM0574]